MAYNTGMTVKAFTSSQDVAYRAGLVAQGIAATAFSVLYAIEHEYVAHALMGMNVAVLATVFFAPLRQGMFKTLMILALAGCLMQMAGTLEAMPYDARVFYIGLGLTLLSGAAVAAADAMRYGHLEGWLFLLVYPVAIVPNFQLEAGRNINILTSALVLMMHVLFLKKKLPMPLGEKRPERERAKPATEPVIPASGQADGAAHPEAMGGDETVTKEDKAGS